MWIVHSLPSELAYSQSILRILQVFPFHFSIPPLSGTCNRQVVLILLEYREQGGHGSAHCTGRTQLPVRKQGPPPLPFRGTQNWRAQVLSQVFRVMHPERWGAESGQKKKTLVHTIFSGVPIRRNFSCWRIPKKKTNTFWQYIHPSRLKSALHNPSHNTASSAIPACSHHIYTCIEKASIMQTFDAFPFDIWPHIYYSWGKMLLPCQYLALHIERSLIHQLLWESRQNTQSPHFSCDNTLHCDIR